jgi:hypothetical protein
MTAPVRRRDPGGSGCEDRGPWMRRAWGVVNCRVASVVWWNEKGPGLRTLGDLPSLRHGSSVALNRRRGTVVVQGACRLRSPLGRERSLWRWCPAFARGVGSAVCVSRWRETPERKEEGPSIAKGSI